MRQAVFIDRDGTLGGDGWYCHLDRFELFPESIPSIKMLNDNDFLVIVITNQTHIGHGEITLDQVNASFERIQIQLREHEAHLDGWYICPHTSHDNCQCRKPSPQLIIKAARDFDVYFPGSYMIGDSGVSDIGAGLAARCKTILVLTGLGRGSMTDYRHEWRDIEPDYVADDVLKATEYIVASRTERRYM